MAQTLLKCYHDELKFLQNAKYTLKKWPKHFKILPKQGNFANFGHTSIKDPRQKKGRERVCEAKKVEMEKSNARYYL